jgi:hypothetical protein
MSFEGRIENGCVVFDQPVALAEGTPVRVEPTNDAKDYAASTEPERPRTLAERLGTFLGHTVDLPEDAALNHDHYLYGAPKK